MESQRVRLLLEGYLRGWLNFEYPNSFSYIREEIILSNIFEERLQSIYEKRLFIDTAIKSSLLTKGKVDLDSIHELFTNIVDLKLPLLAAKDKIKKESNRKNSKHLTDQDIEVFKKELAELQKIKNVK